jgi:hypothetical protein
MTYIENEARYEAAIKRRIQANRAKTGRAKWFAAHEDAQTLHDWLFHEGEFSDHNWLLDPLCHMEDGYPEHRFELGGKDYRCKCKRVDHPLSFYARGEFLRKMRDTIDNWGGLTDGQHAAVAKAFANAKEKLAGRDVKRAEALAVDINTNHVGTVGERRDFDLTAERTHSFDSQFGTTYITIFRDADNNVIVYKGSIAFERNQKVRGKATIKAHDVREGVPQTIVARPKFEEAE